MALSNWDVLAVNLKGEPSTGVHDTPMGVRVEFYKNWIYIFDQKAWRGGSYTEPCVAEIHQGELSYMDARIAAIRGPQNGIYAVVWSGWEHKGDLDGMVGCGVYGYGDDHDEEGHPGWVGVLPESVEWLKERLTEQTHISDILHGSKQGDDGRWHHTMMPLEYETYAWDVGIGAGMPEVVRAVDFSLARRYNQGDAYFAAAFEKDVPSTPPGEAQPTILQKITDGMKEEEDG